MAAHSRPSLRSSTRKNESLEEVLPTKSPENLMLNPRRGKRTRDPSPGSQSNASIKKQKGQTQDTTRPKSGAPIELSKSIPIRDKSGTKNVVTQVGNSRTPDPPQRIVDGSTTTALNEQAFSRNNTLTTNVTNTLSQAEKRSLRSHDGGSRSKSELALYFPNFDELVSIEPKEPGRLSSLTIYKYSLTLPEFLTAETIVHITEDPSKSTIKSTHPSSTFKNGANKLRPPSSHAATLNGSSNTFMLSGETFTTLNNATRIDIASIDKSTRHVKDPLTDAVYLKAHRRAERQEKQLRNIEKERAMHEKVQLERLLEGLKGHDWLKVMGISGITDSEKKAFEPKRDYFIREVRILLEKFREWKEEEKRRKVEREESMQDEDEELDEEEAKADEGESDGDPPDYSDVDASAARQLHQEAILATNGQPGKSRSHRRKEPTAPPIEKPFTSFYAKQYLREAAVGKHRRGRTRFAFGQPLPEPEDGEFSLPGDILNPERVAASARRQRVSKRQSKGPGVES